MRPRLLRSLAHLGAGLAVASGLLACGQDADANKETRSDVVTSTAQASSKAASSKPGATATAAASATSEPRHGKLCSASNRVEKDLPKVKYGRIDASDTIGEGSLETGGTWTWINVWAGWCGPCKAEIPLLQKLRDRLAKDGTPARVAFVSIDDDDREARKFVTTHDMKETLYLPEGKERAKLLESLGAGASTALPIQVFVDPQGSIRCVAHGEITEADYAELTAMFAKK